MVYHASKSTFAANIDPKEDINHHFEVNVTFDGAVASFYLLPRSTSTTYLSDHSNLLEGLQNGLLPIYMKNMNTINGILTVARSFSSLQHSGDVAGLHSGLVKFYAQEIPSKVQNDVQTIFTHRFYIADIILNFGWRLCLA